MLFALSERLVGAPGIPGVDDTLLERLVGTPGILGVDDALSERLVGTPGKASSGSSTENEIVKSSVLGSPNIS